MNKNIFLTVLGLLIISGALLFFFTRSEKTTPIERSDVVILIEKTPSGPQKKMPNLENSSEPLPKESEDPEISDYAIEIQETLNTFPTISTLQDLSEKDVHHTPSVIRESGERIAAVIAKADSNPKLRKEAMNFLKDCAETTDSAPSIRALCWKKLVQNIPRWKIFIPLTSADVPQDIKDLASKL